MIRLSPLLVLFLLACSGRPKIDYPIQPVAFTDVHLTDSFWSSRLETNRTVTIPSDFEKCKETGRIANFEIAGGLKKGEFASAFPFDDSDVYKIMEGAAYSLAIKPDPQLEAYLDELIAKISAAQEKDGYLQTWRTINPNKPPTSWSGAEGRWSDTKNGHELYNVGHMYEAAAAHYLATGKKDFLKVALKNADLIAGTFGPGKLQWPPGHEEIEIGLIKLYRITGRKKYLDLADFFIKQRGNAKGRTLYGMYYQDQRPLVEETEATGHAVRAAYFYSGAADVAALTNDAELIAALDRIWENVVSKKLYITGGIGARRKGEAFGDNYELPNATAYNETCAAIANVLWNQRMFLLKGDAKYIDLLERTLYNGLIVGVSLNGDEFFYPNPLEFDGKTAFNQGATTRKPWFNCSCCPSNVARFIPSLPGYFYAQRSDSIYVNLYASNNAELALKKTRIILTQETGYPWDGHIKIKIDLKKSARFVLKLRIPGWAGNSPVPGDLYSYRKAKAEEIIIKVNGEAVDFSVKKGYASLERKWHAGETVDLVLPMAVKLVQANENVDENFGKASIERGPIVYCAEAVDNFGKVLNLALNANVELQADFHESLLNGVVVIFGEAQRLDHEGTRQQFRAVPYYAWGHRSVGEMAVWLPLWSH